MYGLRVHIIYSHLLRENTVLLPNTLQGIDFYRFLHSRTQSWKNGSTFFSTQKQKKLRMEARDYLLEVLSNRDLKLV